MSRQKNARAFRGNMQNHSYPVLKSFADHFSVICLLALRAWVIGVRDSSLP